MHGIAGFVLIFPAGGLPGIQININLLLNLVVESRTQFFCNKIICTVEHGISFRNYYGTRD